MWGLLPSSLGASVQHISLLEHSGIGESELPSRCVPVSAPVLLTTFLGNASFPNTETPSHGQKGLAAVSVKPSRVGPLHPLTGRPHLQSRDRENSSWAVDSGRHPCKSQL